MDAVLITLAALCAVVLGPSTARADLIAGWNFNDQNLTVDHGAGTMSHTWKKASYQNNSWYATTLNRVASDSAGYGLFLEANNSSPRGKYAQWVVDMTGKENLVLTLAFAAAVNTEKHNVAYSTDGANFINLLTDLVPATVSMSSLTSPLTANFSAVTALDNQPTVYIRLVYSNNGANDWFASVRLDNVQFNAVPLPPPGGTVLLLR